MLAGFFAWKRDLILTDAGILASTLGLFASSLVAVYAVLASWHTKLEAEPGYRKAVTGRARRSMGEAIAHCLASSAVAAVAAVLSTVLASLSEPLATSALGRALSAVLVALAFYVVVSFMMVINLLFVAHDNAIKGAERESKEMDRREAARMRESHDKGPLSPQ